MPVVPRARVLRALVVLLSVLPGARAHAACTGFGAAATYAAGAAPQMVASGDFDGDGISDLAVACQSGASLEILRGLGGGAFGAPAAYTSGTGARALAVGDWNGDGRADVAVCVSNGVAVWLGDGHGAFAGGTIFPAGSSPAGIACGDFDADGIMDLAVASSITSAALVLRGRGANGTGDGTFDPPAAYAVGGSPARLVAADLDGDGILDLVVANNTGASVSVLRGVGAAGRGDGTFLAAVSTPVAGSPWGLAAVDWNLDGVPDLVVSNGAGTFLTLLRGTGGGAFAPAGTVTTPAAPRDLVAGDFDGDGIADIATACAAGNDICVLRGTGAGFAPLVTLPAAAGASGLAGGDWNGDGSPDLVSANAGGSSVSRFLGSCPPAPTAAVTLLAPLGSETWWPGTAQQVRWTRGAGVLAVDVEISRDGGQAWTAIARGLTADHLDLVATGTPAPSLRARVRDALVPGRVAASPGDFTLCGVLGAPIASAAGGTVTHLAAGDVDGDGILDLVCASASALAVLRGDGHGRFLPLATLAADGTRQLAIADADGDGVADVIRASAAGVGVLRGDGTGRFGPETLLPAAGVTSFATGDFDADGRLDIAALASLGADAQLLVWRSSAPGVPWSVAVAGAPGALSPGDFDGDGLADLAVGAGGSVQIWYGGGLASRGDGTFFPGPVRALPSHPGDLAVADLDGDGTPDVLACLPATADLVQLPFTVAGVDAGLAAFATTQVTSAGSAPYAPVPADLDGDGRADVVAVLAGENTLAVFRGGAGGFAPAMRFAAGLCATAVVLDDFTGDGHPDVVVATTDGGVLCLPAPCPPQVPAALVLDSPSDTTGACLGFTRTLRWMRSASVPAVRVELSRDGGAHWSTLADGVVAGRFTWLATGAPTDDARLRVSDASCRTRFDSGARFAIRAPFVAPVAGDGLAGARAFACDAIGSGAPGAAVSDGATIQWLQPDAAGAFRERARWSEPGTLRLLLRDLDGDGVPELLSLHADALVIRRGLGAGAFGSPVTMAIEAGSADVVTDDFDEDGVADLALASGNGVANRVSVRRGLGNGADGALSFGPPVYTALATLPTALAAADLDGDGVLDLVAACSGGLSMLRGGGSGGRGNGAFRVVGSRAFGAGDARSLTLADLDGDGRVDVAAADSALGALLVAAGDGAGGFAAPVVIAATAAPLGVAVLDADRDGTADLVASLANGDVSLWRGVPGAPLPSRFAGAGRLATGGAGGALVLRDADGDGIADAIVSGSDGHVRALRGGLAPGGAPRLAGGLPPMVALGAELALSWTRPAGVTLVDVELSRDDGAHWSRIASDLGGGSWRWTVTGPLTGVARLRVTDAQVPASADSAGAPFAIDPVLAGVTAAGSFLPALGAPWPNPAAGTVAFALALPASTRVRLDVCDIGGRRVATLADGVFAAGTHALRWSGADARGTPVPPGVYFVRAQAPGFRAVRRIVRY